MNRALVLRPEPGNAATRARLADLGVPALALPLFEVRPIAWTPPPPDRYDALLLTSANAVRHAGARLRDFAAMPVVAVGAATAAAVRAAGLHVAVTGSGDAADALAATPYSRLLHLAGAHRRALTGVDAITVYESAERPLTAADLPECRGVVALLHSSRAAVRFAALVPHAARGEIALAALSSAVAAAAGEGWRHVTVAATPHDAALVACAASIIDPPAAGADKPTP